METAEMRRSTLQRKDREELTEIATTLGRKPPSRARKGEIIDLILDLAAGGDGSGVAGADDETAEATEAKDATPDGGDGSDTDRAGADGADAASEDEAAPSGDATPDAGQGERQGDSPDPGNRRRRRRGRERENNRDTNEAWDGEPIPVAGHLELRSEGYGFLRVDGALPSKDDAYVPVKMVRQFGLRRGDHLTGASRPANRNEKNPAMVEVATVNGGPPEAAVDRPDFDGLVSVFPNERIVLAGDQAPADPTARVIDLLTPIGKGQRALVAAPPRTGETTLLKHVIRALEHNHPELDLFVVLLDERPEDVTDMQEWVTKGEVAASAFDRPTEEQTTVAEMTMERAKRMVEDGRDVVVVLDGITRLARAYNMESPHGGRAVQGSVDRTAIHPSKRFLGAARNVDGGGSLTVIATIAVETGSATDEIIYEELGDTANLELRLDRAAAVRRIFPAVDIGRSATLNEELLFSDDELEESHALRRRLASVADAPEAEPAADLQALLDEIAR